VDPDLIRALKALAEPSRLRIAGRLAAGSASAETLARELGEPLPAVARHVSLMRRVGLVAAERQPVSGAAASETAPSRPAVLVLRIDRLQAIGRQLDELERSTKPPQGPMLSADGQPIEGEDAKILRSYLEDGHLTMIPASTRKRDVVLRWLRDQVFTEDRPYPEKEVNQRLGIFHRDVASLRRYMVDTGLVDREAGMYRRR
jgi:hypothetical protein